MKIHQLLRYGMFAATLLAFTSIATLPTSALAKKKDDDKKSSHSDKGKGQKKPEQSKGAKIPGRTEARKTVAELKPQAKNNNQRPSSSQKSRDSKPEASKPRSKPQSPPQVVSKPKAPRPPEPQQRTNNQSREREVTRNNTNRDHDHDHDNDRNRNQVSNRDRDHDHDHDHSHNDRDRNVYLSHPRSSFTLSFGNGYAGQGYYYGPSNSSYYYERPEVRYYSTREAAPREYYTEDTVDTGYYNSTEAMAVQRELTRQGYYQGTIDGDIGPVSSRAIADYQSDNGLQPTGEIDAALLRTMGIN